MPAGACHTASTESPPSRRKVGIYRAAGRSQGGKGVFLRRVILSEQPDFGSGCVCFAKGHTVTDRTPPPVPRAEATNVRLTGLLKPCAWGLCCGSVCHTREPRTPHGHAHRRGRSRRSGLRLQSEGPCGDGPSGARLGAGWAPSAT